jgi:hypothetical protein
MEIGDLVGVRWADSIEWQGIITRLSGCKTMVWVAWTHLGMKVFRVPAKELKVINRDTWHYFVSKDLLGD